MKRKSLYPLLSDRSGEQPSLPVVSVCWERMDDIIHILILRKKWFILILLFAAACCQNHHYVNDDNFLLSFYRLLFLRCLYLSYCFRGESSQQRCKCSSKSSWRIFDEWLWMGYIFFQAWRLCLTAARIIWEIREWQKCEDNFNVRIVIKNKVKIHRRSNLIEQFFFSRQHNGELALKLELVSIKLNSTLLHSILL